MNERRIAIASGGFSTRVIEDGAGPPVLMLHGSPDSASEWEPLAAALGGQRRSIAPDLPGLGQCDEPPPAFQYTPEAHGRFIDDVLAAVGVTEPLTLVVHDIGGVFGLPWAAANVSRLSGVVITNTVAFAGFDWFAIARTWGARSLLGRERARFGMWAIGKRGGQLFERIMHKQCPDLPKEALQRMTRELALNPVAKRSSLRLFREMTRPNFFDGYAAHLQKLVEAVPVHVVWGEHDPFIPPRYAKAFGAKNLDLVNSGGHWVPLTDAARVAAAVLSTSRTP
jgi:haloalkane dehalogenase